MYITVKMSFMTRLPAICRLRTLHLIGKYGRRAQSADGNQSNYSCRSIIFLVFGGGRCTAKPNMKFPHPLLYSRCLLLSPWNLWRIWAVLLRQHTPLALTRAAVAAFKMAAMTGAIRRRRPLAMLSMGTPRRPGPSSHGIIHELNYSGNFRTKFGCMSYISLEIVRSVADVMQPRVCTVTQPRVCTGGGAVSASGPCGSSLDQAGSCPLPTWIPGILVSSIEVDLGSIDRYCRAGPGDYGQIL
jgi:hypothetical protein